MPLANIGPRSGGAKVTINAVEYNTIYTSMDFETSTNLDDVSVFASEPNPDFEEGASISRFALGGRLKEGSAEAGPVLPLPQRVPVVLNYGGNGATGNKLSFTGSFSSLRVSRVAMNLGVLASAGVCVSAIVKTWAVA